MKRNSAANLRFHKFIFIFILFSIIAVYSQAKNDEGKFKTPTPFSIQMHTLSGNFENHKKAVDLVKEAGIKQVRDELFWHKVETTKGEYVIPENCLKNFEYTLEQGIDTLIILNYANDLYEKGMAPTEEESLKAFAKYAATLAEKLKGKVHYFEVWNEPNVDGFWRPAHDAAAYAKLLKYVYPAVKNVNPDAVVMGISLSGIEPEFINQVFEFGGYDYIDAISLHPYCTPVSPEKAEIFRKMEKHYENFKKYGKQKPVWITEVGWPTNKGGGVSEEIQADYTARTYLISMAKPFIKTTFIYWFGPDGQDENWAEDRFSLLHSDYSPKPGYYAVKNLTNIMKNAAFDKILSDDKIKNYRFKNSDKKYIHALWASEGTANLAAKTDADTKLILRDGIEKTLSPFDNKIYISLSSSPVYLISEKEIEFTQEDKPSFYAELADKSSTVPRGFSKKITVSKNENAASISSVSFISQYPKIIKVETTESANKSSCTAAADKDAVLGNYKLYSFVNLGGKPNPSVFIDNEIEMFEPLNIFIFPLMPESDGIRKFRVEVENLTGTKINAAVKISAEKLFTEDEKPEKQLNLSASSISIDNFESGKKEERIFTINSAVDDDAIILIRAGAEINSEIRISAERKIDFYVSYKAKLPLKIDGDLSDWEKKLKPINICYKGQVSGGYIQWEGKEDSCAKIYTTWDDKYLYFGIELADDFYSDPVTGFAVYNNDGVELYMDTDYLSDFKEKHYSDDDFQYGLFPSAGKDVVFSWKQLGKESEKSVIKINRTPEKLQTISSANLKGMIIEAAIPLEELKLRPKNGAMIGFTAAYTDDDDPKTIHPFFQELQMNWTAGRNCYQNPHAFAFMFFGEK